MAYRGSRVALVRMRDTLAAVDATLQRGLIRDTALWMLGLRLGEGVSVWIVFFTLYDPTPVQAWIVYAVVAAYMIVNAFLALRYRAGDIRLPWIVLDVVANLVPITIVLAQSGGLASPLVLLYPVKVAGYLIIFSPEIGWLGIGGSLAGLAILGATGFPVLWQGAPIKPRALRHLNVGTHLAFVLTLFLVGTPLVRRVRRQRDLLRIETDKGKAAAEREHNTAVLAGTLLMVTDAVGRQIRLDDVLAAAVDIIPRILNVDDCGVIVWDERQGVYSLRAMSGAHVGADNPLQRIRLTPEEAVDLEWVRRLGQCTVVPPTPGTPLSLEGAPVLLLAPLICGGRFFGVLLLARREGTETFTQRDITVADGVAAQVAVALERADLFEDAQRLLRALDSTGESVVITDTAARVLYANSAFLRTFGHTRENVLGKDAFGIVSNLSPQWITEVTAAAQHGGWRGELDTRRPDGAPLPLLIDVSVIRDGEGRARGAVAIFEDISDRRQVQERMQRAERLASAGTIAAGIAHEVNNALVGILHEANRADTEADPETLRAALHRVGLQGNRIATIVQGLLGFAQPRAPERGKTGVEDLITETLELHRYELASSHIAVEVEVAANLPSVWVDRKQIQQVLVNLITNAQQAMAPQGGRLSIAAVRTGSDISITVADTGPGIPPEQLRQVFDPFFTTKSEGTGLGLSVSYQIVRAHEGDLLVESHAGCGATFVVRLPTADAAPYERALVVDDDPIVGHTLVEMLEQQGLTAEHVLSGTEALTRLQGDREYDVVFLDVRLPDLSGPQVYAQLAASSPSQARRVIFVTGGLWRSSDTTGLRDTLPPQPALAKPCTAQQVRDVLQTLRQRLAAAA